LGALIHWANDAKPTYNTFGGNEEFMNPSSYVRGEVNEPYCCQECFDKASQALATALSLEMTGPCTFCQKFVQYRAAAKSIGSVLMFPYRKQKAFLCAGCRSRAEDFMKTVDECCWCGKPLPTDRSNELMKALFHGATVFRLD
jgi:hypothetical protein